MGIAYCRQTNALNDCTAFESNLTGTRAYYGENVTVSMLHSKHNQTDEWKVLYETSKARCCFILKATRENNRIDKIEFSLRDSAYNVTYLKLDIERVGRCGLHAAISNVNSSNTTRRPNSLEPTTIAQYECSHRKGLVVVEEKKKVNSDAAYMVTVAHYFIIKDIGFSVAAKVRRNQDHGFVVEVEGPFSHPSADLEKVLVTTCQTGIWSPGACSHCSNGAYGSINTNTGGSNSTLSDDTISRILKRAGMSGNGDQPYTGLINSSEVTDGILNKSVVILIDFSGAKINSGANSGDHTTYRHCNHYGERPINKWKFPWQ